MPDQDAADLKFRTGELDGLDNIKPENYHWYEENQKRRELHAPQPRTRDEQSVSSGSTSTRCSCRVPERSFRRGRRSATRSWIRSSTPGSATRCSDSAVSMAIDRDAMIRSVFFGEGTKNWSHLRRRATRSGTSRTWCSTTTTSPSRSSCWRAWGSKDGNGDGVLEDTRGNPISFHAEDQRRQHPAGRDGELHQGRPRQSRHPVSSWGRSTSTRSSRNLRNDFQYDAILLGIQSGVPPNPVNGAERRGARRASPTIGSSDSRSPSTPEETRIDQLMDGMVTTLDPAAAEGPVA